MNSVFSIVPIEVWRDKRLTLEQIRVLGVLLSFRRKNTDAVWPSRGEIAARCGMHLSNISSATSALERLGWISKEGKGGHSKATRYTITAPEFLGDETVTESATVSELTTVAPPATAAPPATVAESATRLPVARSATPPVAYSATRKEQSSEQTKVSEHTPPPAASKSKRQPITFDTFAERKKAAGEKLIAEDDPIFGWAEGAGIPDEWLHLAWIEFANRYRGNAKQYADWPQTFRNAVRNNWYKLWRAGGDGTLTLTTEGELARRAAEANRRTHREATA
ncbi:helix-turn-helix domain-containing protein [Thauera sp.]|uniref:helix-turn-helix domain-containing protein n=1 Tax=Thauera sp. TaxID=1905334 RepID=UPI0039E3748D